MKYNRIFVLSVLICIFLFGCNIVKPSDTAKGTELSKNILECFEEKDAEGIKSILCDKSRNISSIDEQINIALDLFDGAIVSHDKFIINSGTAYDKGELTWMDVRPQIRNIVTSDGKKYNIYFSAYIVNVNNPEIVGVSEIRIELEDNTVIQIGESVY